MNRTYRSMIVPLFVLMGAALSLAAEPVELPILISGRTPLVEGRINGKGPYSFVIDTGSSQTQIDAELATELGLDRLGSEDVDIEGENGEIGYPVGVLELGDLEFRDVTARSWDSHPMSPGSKAPHGILGTTLFERHLLTIDNPRKLLIISRGELPGYNGRDILSYTLVDDVPQVEAWIGDAKLELQIHSGAFGPLQLRPQWMDQLPLRTEPGKIGNVTIDGINGDILGSRLDGSLTIGQFEFDRPSVHFSTAFPADHIGYGSLVNFAITLDQVNQRIQLQAERSYDELLASRGGRVPSLDETAPDLKTAFNRDKDKTRLIIILSPT